MKGFLRRPGVSRHFSRCAKYIRPALILCLVLAVCGGVFSACGRGGSAAGNDPAKEDGYMKITMEQAQNLMKTEENYIILDVRRED